MRGEPIYRGILGIDIEGFNRPEWTDPTRARLRARLHRLVDRAIAVAEIALSSTVRTDTGDGLWLLVSSEVSTARLLHPLVSRLASGLAGDNQQVPAAERLRLRVAVHAGEVLHDPYGRRGAGRLRHGLRGGRPARLRGHRPGGLAADPHPRQGDHHPRLGPPARAGRPAAAARRAGRLEGRA